MELLEKENAAFIKLIDQAVLILSERKADDNYKIFQDRYGKMMEYLEKLRRMRLWTRQLRF